MEFVDKLDEEQRGNALMIAKEQLERGAWKVQITDNNATPEAPDYARGDVLHGL